MYSKMMVYNAEIQIYIETMHDNSENIFQTEVLKEMKLLRCFSYKWYHHQFYFTVH